MDFLRPYAPQLLSILRIMSGLLVLQHGTAKYLNIPVFQADEQRIAHDHERCGRHYRAGVRRAPCHRTVHTAVRLHPAPACALWPISMRTLRAGFFPLLNRGELAALYSFVFLYLAAAGGGPWSVDRARGGD